MRWRPANNRNASKKNSAKVKRLEWLGQACSLVKLVLGLLLAVVHAMQ